MWSSCDDESVPWDRNYNLSDFSVTAFAKATKDLLEFKKKTENLKFEVDYDQVAHDLWLSRNGHGTGFFDKPEFYGEHCKGLQQLARDMGECHIQLCSNGKLEFI